MTILLGTTNPDKLREMKRLLDELHSERGEFFRISDRLLDSPRAIGIDAESGAGLGAQSANLAVDGYGNDQAYLRLEAELPRFRHPIAVVAMA